MKSNVLTSIIESLHPKNSEESLPQNHLNFKSDLEIVPHWVDHDLLLEGCKLSERSGLVGLHVLRNFALLADYNFANLTQPLFITGSLEKGAVHRPYNTLSFWVEVS